MGKKLLLGLEKEKSTSFCCAFLIKYSPFVFGLFSALFRGMTKTEYKSYEKTLNYDDHCACRFAPSQAAEFNLAAYAEFDLVAPFIIGHNLLTLLSPLWTSNLLFMLY